MTREQIVTFIKTMIELRDNQGMKVFHHGGCIGADREAHNIVHDLGYLIYVHPCDIKDKQAVLPDNTVLGLFEEKPPLVRNKDIVKACDFLVAIPGTRDERVRSGTWATIRQARKMRCDHKIIYPSGAVSVEMYANRPLERYFDE